MNRLKTSFSLSLIVLIGMAFLIGILVSCTQETPVREQEAPDFRLQDLPFQKVLDVQSEDQLNSITLTIYTDDASVLDLYTVKAFSIAPIFEYQNNTSNRAKADRITEKIPAGSIVGIQISNEVLVQEAIGYNLAVDLPESAERAYTWEYYYNNSDYGRVTLNSSLYNVFISTWSRNPGSTAFNNSLYNIELEKKGGWAQICASGSQEIKIGVRARKHSSHYSLQFFPSCP
ncbi:MAG: hypothetical protein AAFP89_22925 [Bacteroidota bacterium]